MAARRWPVSVRSGCRRTSPPAAWSRWLPGRVRVVPPALAMVPPVRRPGACGFGLPDDAVVVLVSFNLASSLARKNPFAAIAAFRGHSATVPTVFCC